ncbi:MAG TPA: penicillin acylase family protein, partial [Thermoanaerobaculia bacterium]|nr:penicillin acylase family protein [Thermoanaerobaculia bacterium]
VLDLRRLPVNAALGWRPAALAAREEARPMLGSNSWALAGSRTADGHALLADDMHLDLRVPNLWYRVSLLWPQGGRERRMTGVTLPGAPMVVVGSNGHVAWGFTNSFGDWMDLVVLETDPARPDLYRTPEGFRPFEHSSEVIRVRGGRPRLLDVRSTIWGPVIDKDHRGRPRALAWTAQREEAVDLGLLGFESADDLESALSTGAASGVPAQNLLVADDTGRIGWTIAGRIPRRFGFRGEWPSSWADGRRGWNGWLPPSEVPRIVDPPSGQLWTANNRVLDIDRQLVLGDGGYDLGARAGQIRDDLTRLTRATPRDLLAIQLDDRALFLERWRDLLLRTLTPQALAGHPRRAELRRIVATGWNGHAAIDSSAFRLVRSFRLTVFNAVLQELVAPSHQVEPSFGYDLEQAEGPLWRAVSERPPHLLSAQFHSWDELFQSAVDAVVLRFSPRGEPLSATTWGQANYVLLRHPLSPALPGLSFLIDMPPHSLPGCEHTPLYQDREWGASERMVISPGQEAEGIFEMPGGQSGNPLSAHYRDSYPAWVRGEPAPFLPGATADRLDLTPSPRPAG